MVSFRLEANEILSHTSGAEDAIMLSQIDSLLLVWSYCGKKKRESGSQGYTVTKAAANKLEGAQRVHQGAEVPEAPQGQLGWHRIEACWSRARLVERSLVGTFLDTRPTLATTPAEKQGFSGSLCQLNVWASISAQEGEPAPRVQDSGSSARLESQLQETAPALCWGGFCVVVGIWIFSLIWSFVCFCA